MIPMALTNLWGSYFSRIEERHDPVIYGIVKGWPTRFDARRARELGFVAESSFDEIIRAHVEDELGGRI